MLTHPPIVLSGDGTIRRRRGSAVRAAWLQDMFLPPDVLEWALNAVVVRSGGKSRGAE
jgi:hypothetical protein